mmetsp:Transcript_7695/g.16468  ORF Transcript_7695/g.16468 Transcript_7695/m.16468 type:complete len:109 (+) Transcript_7695:1406-1732(+)
MKTIGYKLTALSPTRGSSAELASSLMVVTASYMGIPVSTTQCIVGATSQALVLSKDIKTLNGCIWRKYVFPGRSFSSLQRFCVERFLLFRKKNLYTCQYGLLSRTRRH